MSTSGSSGSTASIRCDNAKFPLKKKSWWAIKVKKKDELDRRNGYGVAGVYPI